MKLFIKYKIEVYYLFISLFFSLQSLSLIDNSGDQDWFADMAKQIDYNYIQFAIDRYFNWSSRLMIESATMFFSVHQRFFSLVFFLVTFFFISLSRLIFLKNQSKFVVFLLPILFLFIFPSYLFTSAGLIATVTNYYFPMFTLITSWYFLVQSNWKSWILALPFFIYTIMQEQFAVFSFLLLLYAGIQHYTKFKSIHFGYFVGKILSILGIISAIISPGSGIRKLSETQTWYPNFDQISLLDKIFLGFIDTNRILFIGEILVFLFVILILTTILTGIKKKIYPFIVSSSLLLLFVLNRLGLITSLRVFSEIVSEVKTIQFDIKTYYLIFVMLTVLFLFIYIIWNCFNMNEEAIFATILLIIGYLSRMLVSFSPTIYASQERTFIPLVFSGYIVSILLLNKISKEKNI
ncbi:hypothetical protein ACVRZG_05610 [Streptococcus hyovaginalis]|uniref:hypothetical protein n=1 Tax=Streptococcus hyovaginalis TaxID=149015 RepID=UPI00041984E7|nr:hypothetical protein [Streptococcus hyovaginalis]